jgi:aldose 1-epimerase
MRPWTVVESGDARARMVLENVPARDAAAEWPFAYLAEQVFELAEDGVTITLSVRNTDARPWPAGLGLHPYVARTPEARLMFEADTVWVPGADGLPAARVAVAGVYEFAGDEQLGAMEIDACYAGWGGSASVALPEDGLTLVLEAGPPLDHLQLYTPAGRDFMGLEPVTNMPDAINRMEDVADQGLVVLAPGEMLTAVARMGVRAAGVV